MQMTVKFHRHSLKMQIACDDKVIFTYYFLLLMSSIFCLSGDTFLETSQAVKMPSQMMEIHPRIDKYKCM